MEYRDVDSKTKCKQDRGDQNEMEMHHQSGESRLELPLHASCKTSGGGIVHMSDIESS